uniref:Uncharacterized protein n=1 Tax=Ignisphaera aggregans TaxID=334771 RepID=A0A7C4FDC5_9CREN
MGLAGVIQKLYRVYMYPARFPTKIFDVFFSKADLEGVFFDPFAGSGSFALACYLMCRDFVVWDINPMMQLLVHGGISIVEGVSIGLVRDLVEKALGYGRPWLPQGAEGWWPEQVLDVTARVWGFFRDEVASFNPRNLMFEPLVSNSVWSLFALACLYASRRLSFTDDSVPKWFRSRVKREKITKMLKKTTSFEKLRSLFMGYVEKKLSDFSIAQRSVFKPLCKPGVQEVVIVDAVKATNYPEKVVGVLTSPPYLQAQEYIRSFSWELKLLGVPPATVSMLSKLEIPYRPPINVKIESETYYEVLQSIDPKMRRLVESYFTNTITVLEKSTSSLVPKGIIGIFVGDTTVRGKPIPIVKIFKEHLAKKMGLALIDGGEIDDEIKRRRLFKGRKNASPNGIKIEHLIFLTKQ